MASVAYSKFASLIATSSAVTEVNEMLVCEDFQDYFFINLEIKIIYR